MSFSEAIKDFRQGHDLSQAKMSRIFGVSEGTISLWERGKVEPKQHLVWERIYNFLPEVRDERLRKRGLKLFQEAEGGKHGTPQDAILFTLLKWQAEFGEFFEVEYGDKEVTARLKLD